jgi:hypothetical protein
MDAWLLKDIIKLNLAQERSSSRNASWDALRSRRERLYIPGLWKGLPDPLTPSCCASAPSTKPSGIFENVSAHNEVSSQPIATLHFIASGLFWLSSLHLRGRTTVSCTGVAIVEAARLACFICQQFQRCKGPHASGIFRSRSLNLNGMRDGPIPSPINALILVLKSRKIMNPERPRG